MLWFYLHCVIAIVILIADAKAWEKKLGIPVPEEQSKEEDES